MSKAQGFISPTWEYYGGEQSQEVQTPIFGFSDGLISRIYNITTPGGTGADSCLPQEESTINNCF